MFMVSYGTRPEYIKVKPLISKMRENKIPVQTLFTGQHLDLVNITPDYVTADYTLNFDHWDYFKYGSNRLSNILRNCLSIPKFVFENVDYIIVQGDTTSSASIAIESFHRKIPVIHLEAGLRTYDNYNPYPEEVNRRIISNIATVHFCPTDLNKKQLEKESIQGDIYVVGNTAIDNLLPYKQKCSYKNKVLVTLHRRENHSIIPEWFSVINDLASNKEIEFMIPLHPNPDILKYKGMLTNLRVENSMPHEDILNFLIECKLVITDSGGIQEECSFFNKKCLVCRKTTERPETLGLSSFIVKSPVELKNIYDKHILDYEISIISPYGDGNSSQKICDIIKDKYL